MFFRLKKRKKKNLKTMARKLVTVIDSKSIISEQFRAIRTNITFSIPDQDIKTILVTSATPGEGKSTNAANLAVVFAQDGKKVLIVDADLRKPTLHHTFEIYNTSGLSTVLSRQETYEQVIQQSIIVDLDIISSGPIPPNPTDLLASKTMEAFIADVKRMYDIIIFDAPPILAVADAQLLSNKCDGTLLIVNTGVAMKEDVMKAKAILNNSKARIMGVVLNNYILPRDNHYKYYGVE